MVSRLFLFIYLFSSIFFFFLGGGCYKGKGEEDRNCCEATDNLFIMPLSSRWGRLVVRGSVPSTRCSKHAGCRGPGCWCQASAYYVKGALQQNDLPNCVWQWRCLDVIHHCHRQLWQWHLRLLLHSSWFHLRKKRVGKIKISREFNRNLNRNPFKIFPININMNDKMNAFY